jgi:aspartyl/glutamyl-tRNA(Asn/Gln) amidotransferase C subunit
MLKEEEFERVCKLARIEVEDSQKESFLKKLNGVFDWIEQLSKIDVSGIDINDLADMDDTPERKDVPFMCNNTDELLSNSKYTKFNMYKVPKVIE